MPHRGGGNAGFDSGGGGGYTGLSGGVNAPGREDARMKDQDAQVREAVEYYNRLSVKPYVRPFLRPGEKERPLPPIEGIVALNRDREPFVLQSAAGRTRLAGGGHEPLQFVHFSDIHGVRELWDRVVDYVNAYCEEIAFALHTGDFCGDSQDEYIDFYREGRPCLRPILNCVGNHDTIAGSDWHAVPKRAAWEKLFASAGDFGAAFAPLEHSMSYYRDFPASAVRLIVLDLYYDVEAQAAWLRETLLDAAEKGLSVLTAMHEATGPLKRCLRTGFSSLRDFGADGGTAGRARFEEEICRFREAGGRYVCNLAGHYHADRFGYTEAGVLNVAVECATDWAGWCDGYRTRGTRAYDCFNVVCVDADEGLLKLVRIGDCADRWLRAKTALCYDYRNGRLLSDAGLPV